jgi:hypothetical protein
MPTKYEEPTLAGKESKKKKKRELGSGIEEIRSSIYDEDVNLIKNIFTISVEKQKVKS